MILSNLEKLIIGMGKRLINYKNIICNELLIAYKSLMDNFLKDIEKLYLDYSIEGIWDYKGIYRKNKMKSIMAQIDADLRLQGQLEIDLLINAIKNIVKVDYGLASYMLSAQSKGIVLIPPTIPKQTINDILNIPWTDDHFSDRVWHNKTLLKSSLRRELTSCLVTGESFANTSKRLKKVLGAEAYKAERLVRTEIMAASNRTHKMAIQQFQEQYGKFNLLEGIKVLETLDTKICYICKAMDGKIFPYNKMDEVKELEHPNCRRRIVPVLKGFDESKVTRAARDKEGKYYRTNAKNYKEFAKEQSIEMNY